MSKGGGSQQVPTSSTVTSTNLPGYVEPYFKRLLERTEAASLEEYTPYPNQRLAEFGPDSTEAFDIIRSQAAGGIPAAVDYATLRAGAASQYAPDVANFATDKFTDPGVAGDYMNPYLTNVLDQRRRRAELAYNEARADREGAFRQQGGFSSGRRNVEESLARRDLEDRFAEMESSEFANAFGAAQTAFMSDQERRLQAGEAREGAFREAEGIGLEASELLAGIGELGQELTFDQARELGLVGAVTEDKDQAALDQLRKDFENQRDYPRKALDFYSGILHGVPVSPSSDVVEYQPTPSPWSKVAGIGLGGLGLLGELGKG